MISNAQPALTWHANKRHCADGLSGCGETRELAARARRAALVAISLRIMKGYCTGGRALSSGARPWCDVRAVISNAQPAFTWHANKRHCPGDGETRQLFARARRAVLVVVSLCAVERYCTGGRLLSYGERPWCDERAVTSSAQPAFTRHANERHCADCLSGGGEIGKLAARAHRAMLAVLGLRNVKGCCVGGRPLPSGARPWCDVRAVNFNAQPTFTLHANKRHCTDSLLGCVETRELAARARRPALVAIGLLIVEGYCTGERPLSSGVRPWCDVRAVIFNTQPAFTWHANKRHCADVLSGCGENREVAAHARRAELVAIGPRIMMSTAPAGGLSPRCKTVVRRASRDLQRAAGIHVAREQTSLR